MPKLRLLMLAALLAAAAAPHAGRPGAAPPAVTLETIGYDQLGERVRALESRVVIVDFWADYCAPCKRDFHHLVELHEKYSRRGLSAISVNLDDPADDEARERVKEFLSARKASFTNFLLEEKPATWQAKLKIDGPPCVFVFDRRGRLVKKYHDKVDHADVERLVADLLK